MNIFNSISSFTSTTKTIVTIGTFDGVHIGHKKVLNKLHNLALEKQAESVLLTFFPHPRMVLQQDLDIKLLNTIEEKKKRIASYNIDHLIIHPFDLEFSRLTAEEFVKNVLVDQLNICAIIIGYDHRFGRNRTATIEDLINFGTKYNFDVEQITAKEIDEIAISSTKIRNALLEGDIATANTFLGYNYTIHGEVVEGKKLGRTIHFPTANLQVDESYKLVPKNGVYMVTVEVNNRMFYGMMNIGTNPTVSDSDQSIEVHLFDFNESIYHQNITVGFLEHIREEKKYDSLSDLKDQLEKDKLYCLSRLKNYS